MRGKKAKGIRQGMRRIGLDPDHRHYNVDLQTIKHKAALVVKDVDLEGWDRMLALATGRPTTQRRAVRHTYTTGTIRLQAAGREVYQSVKGMCPNGTPFQMSMLQAPIEG